MHSDDKAREASLAKDDYADGDSWVVQLKDFQAKYSYGRTKKA